MVSELELWAISTGATTCCIDVELYEACRIAGVVERLVVDPQTDCLEATVTDGTARVTARWSLATGAIRGLACGTRILLEGVAVAGPDAQPILDEPALQIADGEFA
ncbi:MAG TPA: hypothetical protein VG318_18135 [Actinomycetota bacterium]|nr:hypothetical protein [Actinomycetota bacterium]